MRTTTTILFVLFLIGCGSDDQAGAEPAPESPSATANPDDVATEPAAQTVDAIPSPDGDEGAGQEQEAQDLRIPPIFAGTDTPASGQEVLDPWGAGEEPERGEDAPERAQAAQEVLDPW